VVVFSGTVFATVLTLFVVPAFYALLCRRTGTTDAVAQRLAQLERKPDTQPAE
jgi:multidrug efflux pump